MKRNSPVATLNALSREFAALRQHNAQREAAHFASLRQKADEAARARQAAKLANERAIYAMLPLLVGYPVR